MTDYLQPEFYRFNEDSLKLVKWVLSKVSETQAILDLGAGCGIIGIELANVLQPQKLTLVEVQKDYFPCLQKNVENLLDKNVFPDIQLNSFKEWRPVDRYDLIVCNPPYYLPGHGEINKDERKATARSFILDDWGVLLKKIEQSLANKGRGFLVIKNDQRILTQIRKNLISMQCELFDEGQLVFVELSRLHEN